MIRLEFKTLAILLLTAPAISLLQADGVQAQAIAPANDGTDTTVTTEGDRFDIEGGQLSGDGENLFHSFEQFNLSAEQIANFLSNPDIQNILGRINGGDPSIINGLIQVTGGNSNLLLMNPSGILFGPDARLDIPASFTATTATGIGFDGGWFEAIGNADYTSLFGDPTNFAFDPAQAASLVNDGQLTVDEGQAISLLSSTVVDTGTIEAPGGTITITAVPAAEPTDPSILRVSQEGSLISLDIPTTEADQLVSGLTAQSLAELITGGEGSLVPDLDVNAAGQVILTATNTQIPVAAGTTMLAGELDVAAPETAESSLGEGGSVHLLGDQVGLVGAAIDASGFGDGGAVLIGGEYQGGGTVPSARQTYVDATSVISADSLLEGNGGRVIAWADQTTQFFGTVSAQGGTIFGDGGFVEVSGAENLTFDGLVHLEASSGQSGTLLLDPSVLIISDNGTNDDLLADGNIFADEGPETAFVSESALEAVNGSIVLEATDLIEINPSDGVLDFQNIDQPRVRDEDGNILDEGETVTFRVTSEDSSFLQFNAGSRDDQRTIQTSGGNLTIDVARAGAGNDGRGSVGTNLFTNGGEIIATSRDGDLFLNRVNTSNANGRGGDIRLSSANNRVAVGLGGDVQPGELVINSSGLSGGGNVEVAGTQVDVTVDSSAIDGPAGDVNLTAEIAIGSTFTPANISASSQNGPAGTTTITVLNPTPGPVNGAIEGIVANSGDGSGSGDLIIQSNEISFAESFDAEELGLPPEFNVERVINVDGTVRLQPAPRFEDRPIVIGGGINEDDPNALDLRATDLAILADPGNQVQGGVFIGSVDSAGNPIGTGTITVAQPVPFASNVTIDAGPGSTLLGPTSDIRTEYTVTGPSQGFISNASNGFGVDADGNSNLRFNNVGQVIAGDGDDALIFENDDSVLPEGFSFDGSEGNNILDFSGYASPIDVDLARQPAARLADDPEVEIIQGEVINITGVIGGGGDDIILGDENDNLLGGGPGGNDIIDGRGGFDTVEETRDIDLTLTDIELSIGTTETDSLALIENAVLIGGAGNNTLTLESSWTGSATLQGESGDDVYIVNLDGLDEVDITIDDVEGINNELIVDGTVGDDEFSFGAVGESLQLALGEEEITYTGIQTVSLDGQDGSDSYVSDFAVSISELANAIAPTITDSGTAGTDSLTVNGFTSGDTGFFEAVEVTGSQIVTTVSGNSVAFDFAGVEVLNVASGGGGDIIRFTDPISDFEALTIDSGLGNDIVEFNEPISNVANVGILTGDGTDRVELRDSIDNVGTLDIETGADSDTIQTTSSIANVGDLSVDAGTGEDTLNVDGAIAANNTVSLTTDTNGGDIQISESITAPGGIDISSGTGTVDASTGTLNTSSADGDGTVNLQGDRIFVEAINAQADAASSGGDITAIANSVLEIGEATSSGNVSLTLETGDLQVTQNVTAADSVMLMSGDGSITTSGAIDAGSDVTLDAGTSINSNGAIVSGGLVSLTSGEEGDISLSEGITAAGITLNSDEGNVNAPGVILDTSSTSGNGGPVTVSGDSIRLGAINAQGGTAGTGGAVTVTADSNLLFDTTFVDQNGVAASISTAGGAGGGAIALTLDAEPFTVGDAQGNGTAGVITSGLANTVQGLAISGGFTQGNITIINPAAGEGGSGNGDSSFPSVFGFNTLDEDDVDNITFPVCAVPVNVDTEELDATEGAATDVGSEIPVCRLQVNGLQADGNLI